MRVLSCSHSGTAGAFHLELSGYPAHNLDLSPSDYHLFTYLKNWMGSQRFNNIEELKFGVEMWRSSQAANLFDTGIQKRFPLYKWLSSGGDYVDM
jgi:hypothetical protein